MSFFNDKKFLLAFLNNSELRLAAYSVSGAAVSRSDYETLTFKSSVIKDSTILDIQSFQFEIASFFAQKKEFRNLPVLLVIPAEKVFLKGFRLGLGDLEKKEFFRNEFISEIPFEEPDLIFHERLIGNVIEFSAIHKRFIDDLKLPFLNQKTPILGVVTVPQIMALDLHPKEKSFLLAFYDNDFALALAENSSILFSETYQLKDGNIKEAMRAFDHFVQHLQAIDIKSISIILGEVAIEGALNLEFELEQREYVIKEIKKISILDMIAGYYNSHKNELSEWNLIRVEESSMLNLWDKYVKQVLKQVLNAFLIILTLLFVGGIGWWAYGQLQSSSGSQANLPAESPNDSQNPNVSQNQESVPTPVEIPAKKSDFPIQIFNGTKLAGEASRLKMVLAERGFTVVGTGNNEDQNQVLTTIFVNSNTPDEIVGDLRLILETRYQGVLVSPSPAMEKDIHIVIGKKK